MFIMKLLRHILFHRKTHAFFLGVAAIIPLLQKEPHSIGFTTRKIPQTLGSLVLGG